MMADRKRVEPLLRTARGQLEGVLRMIDENRYCMDIVTQLQAVESLVHKAQREVLRAHLNGCVGTPLKTATNRHANRKLTRSSSSSTNQKQKAEPVFVPRVQLFHVDTVLHGICFSAAMSASICSSVPTVMRR